jgi:hypothetical protein
MEKNGIDDNDAPASDAVVALDAPGARRDDPPSVMGVDEPRPESERKPSLRGVPRRRARIGRPTRLTPRLAKALVKIIAQTGRIEPAARRCGVPHQTVNDWIERGQGRHPTRPATRPFAEFRQP